MKRWLVIGRMEPLREPIGAVQARVSTHDVSFGQLTAIVSKYPETGSKHLQI